MKTKGIIKDERITKNINNIYGGDNNQFFADCKRFCKALQSGRLIATAQRYGISADCNYKVKIKEMCKNSYINRYDLAGFNDLFSVLGLRISKHNEVLTGGGNVDIIFHTKTYILNQLHHLNIINVSEYRKLYLCNINAM